MLNELVLSSGIGDIFVEGLQMLTFFIDKAVYALVKAIYGVFVNIANISLLGTESGQQMASVIVTRMYVLMALVMVFVLAYNLLNYIIDPDKVSDKKVGASTFIKDVLISIALIALTPTIFTKLYSLQNVIIVDGVIENLILGGAGQDEANDLKENGANSMIASTYAAFLRPANEDYSALDCGTESQHGDYYEIDSSYCIAYWSVQNSGNISAFEDVYRDDNNSFTPFLSTVGGVVLIYFMLIFSISLGKRVGKMAIVELLAPIPLTLEILPNKKGLRDNWIKTSLKIYAEVFIYMAIMFLVIFLISLVPDAIKAVFSSGGGGLIGIISTLILIYGLLMFGKEAPKMVCDLLGIKDTGLITNAIKEGNVGLARFGALGSGLAANVGRISRNVMATEGSPWRKIRSGVAAAASGTVRTVAGLRNVQNRQDAVNLRRNVNDTLTQRRVNRAAYRSSHGGSLGGVIGGHLSDVGEDFVRGAGAYFGTNGDNLRNNAYIQTLSNLQNYVKEGKSDKNTDAEYSAYDKRYKDARSNAYLQDFQLYKMNYGNAKSTEEEFLNWMQTSTSGDASTMRDSYASLLDAYNRREARGDKLDKKYEGKARIAAAQAIEYMNMNPELKTLSINGVNMFNEINSRINEKGEIVSGTTAAELEDLVNKLNTAIVNEKNKYAAMQAAEGVRNQAREARHNNTNSGNSNK